MLTTSATHDVTRATSGRIPLHDLDEYSLRGGRPPVRGAELGRGGSPSSASIRAARGLAFGRLVTADGRPLRLGYCAPEHLL